MQGFNEDPNATFSSNFNNNPHLDSIIYEVNNVDSSSNNFPVRGYMVGGTQSIWAYNSCIVPEFDMHGSYEQLFTSPVANARIGVVSRIENDPKSCNKDKIGDSTSVRSVAGKGRDDTGDFHQYASFNEDMVKYRARIMDLLEAS